MNYSVLMSIYKKDNPIFLKEAIDSILNQTFKSNDIVIIKDGTLTNELEEVLKKYSNYNNISIYGYEENKGLGYALNYGLPLCKNEIVLRMDSDDISDNKRAEIQVRAFLNDNVDVSSTTVKLFEDNINNCFGARKLPLTEKKIKNFSKTRSPFNHPSIIFKKSSVINAGGYKTLFYKEDHYLWIRMIQNGCKYNNLNEPLVYMRIDKNTFFKRKNKIVYKSSKWLNNYMLKTKYISFFTFVKNNIFYFLRQHLPNNISAKITKRAWKE